MDLYVRTTEEELKKILACLGFEITEMGEYFDAKLKEPSGRLHAMFTKLNCRVYCDLHYDNKKHKWFIGVDYKDRPKNFFEDKLKKALQEKDIEFEVKKVNWITRRNKAISKGFKL